MFFRAEWRLPPYGLVDTARFEWIPGYIYLTMAFISILIYYNIYLFFKQIYITKNWSVEKSLTRTLATLTGLYSSVGAVAAMAFVNSYPELKSQFGMSGVSIQRLIFGEIFLFVCGFLFFYYIVFVLRFVLKFFARLGFFKLYRSEGKNV